MTVRAKGLDHVAIVVRDLEESIRLWRDALGLELTHVEEVPEQAVKTAIFGHGMGRVELICPTTQDSGVAKFLASRGEGLHHRSEERRVGKESTARRAPTHYTKK